MKLKKIFRVRGRFILNFFIVILLCSTATILTPVAADSYDESIQYSFEFDNPKVKNTMFCNTSFTKVTMPGCLSIGQGIGLPNLPVSFAHIVLPYDKKIDDIQVSGNPITINVDLKGIDLKNSLIIPYQSPIVLNGDVPKDGYDINEEVYDSDSWFPSTILQKQGVGLSKGYAIASIGLSPVQYNPVDGTLRYYEQIDVTINLVDSHKKPVLYRGRSDDREWVENLVINPIVLDSYDMQDRSVLDYPGGLCDPSDDFDYVIITTEQNGLDFWNTNDTLPYNWDSLMNKHQSEDGLSCTLVTMEEINAEPDYGNSDPLFDDTPAHIREFCKDAYQDWGTSYVLIGGDDEWIPRREMDYDYESNCDSDLYWSNLDNTFNEDGDDDWGEENDGGFDLYSELYIGSLTCDEPQDVSNWMKKSFYYTDSSEKEYLDNAAFFGGNLDQPPWNMWDTEGDDFIDYSAIKGTDDFLGPDPGSETYPSWFGFSFGFETWNANNAGQNYNLSVKWTGEGDDSGDDGPNPGGWQGGSTQAAVNGLKNAINNDQVTFISAIAHANAEMSMDVHDYEWESEYNNTKPFFLHDYGCHCGDMDAADDGVLHSMLFHSDTELAFGCVFHTSYGWGNKQSTNSSSSVQQKYFWDYLFDLVNNSGTVDNWQLGKAQAWSKDFMAPTINWTSTGAPGSWRGTIEACLLFADPAQRLKPPFQPDHGLSVTGLNVADTVAHGETITVAATVRNVGKNNETNVQLNFTVNDSVVNSTIISSLLSCHSEVVSFPWNPAIGTYVVGIEATPVNGENITDNNQVNKTVNVIAAPMINVTPLSFSFMLPTNSSDIDEFFISNLAAAEGTLYYNISWTEDFLSTNSTSGTVPVGESDAVLVQVDTTNLSQGMYTGHIIISSNDLDDGELIIPVQVTVVYDNDMNVVSVNNPSGIILTGTYVVNATVENKGSSDQDGVIVNCSIRELGDQLIEDFEDDAGGYTHSVGPGPGSIDDWEWGNPVSGPNMAHSGSHCWATNLEGDHSNGSDSVLDSVMINLGLYGPDPVISFWHWYDHTTYDCGNVKISIDNGNSWSIIHPESGYTGTATSGNQGIPNEPAFTDTSDGWEQVVFNLSDYEMQTVLLRWHFGSTTSVSHPGWYIDDVVVASGLRSRGPGDLVYWKNEIVSIDAYQMKEIAFTPGWQAVKGNYSIQVTSLLSSDQDMGNDMATEIVYVEGPGLSFTPEDFTFGSMQANQSESTTFEIWNSGIGLLNYTLSEESDWLTLSTYEGNSSGEHDVVTVMVNTTGLSPGGYHEDILISSNARDDLFGVDLFVVSGDEVIDVNQSVFDRGFPIRHAVDGDWAAAQSFTPTVGMINRVGLYARVFGTPEFDLTVELREDGPEGTLVDSVSFTPGEVPITWTWLEIDFVDVTVQPGTDYFIVCPPAPSGVTTSFGYEWGYAFGDLYLDGSFWFTRDGGTLWRDLPTMYEFTFRTYGYS